MGFGEFCLRRKKPTATDLISSLLSNPTGLARITILFRAVELDLPTATQGWETGVLRIDSPIVVKMDPDYQHLLKDLRKVTLDTADGSHVLRSKEAAHNEGGEIRWDADQIRLPVYFRQQAVSLSTWQL